LDFVFDDFKSYNNSLYFLDKKAGQIVKYPYLGGSRWDSPQLWLSSKTTTKIVRADSISIDGSVWALRGNKIYKYYAGNLQREISLDVFPTPQDFSKIIVLPDFSFIYILEPVQKRVLVIDEFGNLEKQLQSDSFDNLLDFAVSNNEKTIYLLDGLKVYKININH